MKILLLTQHFRPVSFRINDMTADLPALGHEATVLTGQLDDPGGAVSAGCRAASTGMQRHEGL